MPINPAIAFGMLTANPETFLREYPVRIFGSTDVSGHTRYYLTNRGDSSRPGSILGTQNWHATESFEIKSLTAIPPLPGQVHHTFDAHSIHMDVGIGAMGTYRLDGTGPSIMVTGQLSGCSFVIQDVGGNALNVSHIQPSGSTGAQLAAMLSTNHPNAVVYGATAEPGFYDSDDRVVSIIGIRSTAGNWTVYAQKQDRNVGDYRIMSVYRIYPDHKKL